MSTTEARFRGLLSDLVADGTLHSQSPIFFNGQSLEPTGDQQVLGGVDEYDDQGLSSDLSPHGGHRIQSVEKLRQELYRDGFEQFAERLPEFFIVPPRTMNSLRDAQEYEKAYPDLDFEVLRDMQYSVSKATFTAMGNPNIGYAIDLRDGESNKHIPNHRAVDLNLVSESKKRGITISEMVGEHYEKVVDRWKNPSDLDFSPSGS